MRALHAGKKALPSNRRLFTAMAATEGALGEFSPKEEKSKIAAAFSYIFIFVLIGVPVWWKTTEVYRVTLPYEDIRALSELTLNIPINITVASCQADMSDADLTREAQRLQQEDLLVPPAVENAEKFGITARWAVRRCSSAELAIVKEAVSISDLDAKLQHSNKDLSRIGSITVYILPRHHPLMKDADVHMGVHRAMFVMFERAHDQSIEERRSLQTRDLNLTKRMLHAGEDGQEPMLLQHLLMSDCQMKDIFFSVDSVLEQHGFLVHPCRLSACGCPCMFVKFERGKDAARNLPMSVDIPVGILCAFMELTISLPRNVGRCKHLITAVKALAKRMLRADEDGQEPMLLQHLLMSDYLHNAVLQASSWIQSAILSPARLQESYIRFAGAKTERPDKTSMRTLPSTAAIDVTFTLILPDPALADMHWDIEAATCEYLEPLADKLKDVVTLGFKSQVLYLTMLDIRAHYNSERKHYVLTADQLPRIVNPVESKLGSYVSTNPGLNFVVYVPPPHQAPLQIYDLVGEPSALNAFLLPRWGGFMLYNAERTDGKDANLPVNMQHVMGIILPQLRSLLGIPHQISSTLSHADLDSSHIRDWELDSVLRMRIVENLLMSTSTLQSLAQLLEEISNIVIADHVGEKVYRAVRYIEDAYDALNDGDIMTAFSSSKKSLIASEAAFFDPSMLALLYFPDDQKYAIYVPLFLPVSLPLVLSIVSAVKYFRSRKASASKTQKVD